MTDFENVGHVHAKKTTSGYILFVDSKRNVQTVVLSVTRRCYTENFLVCEPDEVHQAGQIVVVGGMPMLELLST